ncbi:MAG TPA: phosphate/phosphite/phosphonate ABC transporter substrate-binding protein [Burkholderiaceae bacterium]|nr:phosphate/phosphite/phosphonate ABC transporter substrate-binding protein [Burkholderiaceae bacterium]
MNSNRTGKRRSARRRQMLGFLALAAAGLDRACGAVFPRAANVLTVGVVPQQSAIALARAWTPVLSYLSERTGHTLRFATAMDIPTFEQRLAAGDYDLAYMNPYHYTVFQRAPGYRLIARDRRKLQGIVVVRKDSPVRTITQLKGDTLAFPGPAAFAATLIPQAALKQMGVFVTPQYVSSHDSVYLAVARGLFVAGGGIGRTFDNMSPSIRDGLRILWTTPRFTPHAFAAHPQVPGPAIERVRAAMLQMAQDPRGADLLQALGFEGIVAAYDADYDDIRRLNIQSLEHLIRG